MEGACHSWECSEGSSEGKLPGVRQDQGELGHVLGSWREWRSVDLSNSVEGLQRKPLMTEYHVCMTKVRHPGGCRGLGNSRYQKTVCAYA